MQTEDDSPRYEVGTLLKDMGKIGVISKVIQSGALKTDVTAIKWRLNYEVCYIDGDVQVVGEYTLVKLIDKGIIEILS